MCLMLRLLGMRNKIQNMVYTQLQCNRCICTASAENVSQDTEHNTHSAADVRDASAQILHDGVFSYIYSVA